VAVVGTGVSGVVCAYLLSRRHEVSVFEAEDRPGGHTRTVSVASPEGDLALDTGFIVYNERTYPGLTRLFGELGVPTQPSDMSFSVSDEPSGLEWQASRPGTVFAQRRNLLRPAFLRMLGDVARFNRYGRRLLGSGPAGDRTLGELLAEGRWSRQFSDWYLVPLGSSIWSADPRGFDQIPLSTLVGFFDRHGLLSVGDKPRWRAVSGGARRYVDAALSGVRASGRLHLGQRVEQVLRVREGVEVRIEGGAGHRFDQVVVATHSDQALELLADASAEEKEVLGAIRYRTNQAVLHTDASLMPACRRAWASWNYRRPVDPAGGPTVTYHLNRLQGLGVAAQYFVSLNQLDAVDPSAVVETFSFDHPVIDAGAVAAQARWAEVSGRRGVWFCGAYWGFGFHEDGLQSALRVCRALGVAW
ncbi:MAG TPA: FAD-dependent oxidoreductase, partial [Acidimicrobiales bacterium]|nr:FAD-dependent oxidoreductase [Acidimicrobiales bacterium]